MVPRQRPADGRDARLQRLLLAPILITGSVVAISLVEAVVSPHGVTLELHRSNEQSSRTARVQRIARQEVDRRARGMGEVQADFTGYWYADAVGVTKLNLLVRGAARVALDGRTLIESDSDAEQRLKSPVELQGRTYRIEVSWRRLDEDSVFRLRWVQPGHGFRVLEPASLFVEKPSETALAARRVTRWLVRLLPTLGVLSVCCLAILIAAARRGRGWGWTGPMRVWSSPATRAWAPRVALALLLAYGGLLRLEALIGSFWDVHELWPWAEQLHPRLAELRPETFRWPANIPYRGGDPTAYLRYGRAMENFYGASVREPMFVLATKLGLWLADDHDVGVGIASAAFSTLTIAATYLLGARAFAPLVGLLAAAAFTIEPRVIGLSIQGWRDDAFACFLVFFAWAAVRFYDRGALRDAVLLGVAGGAAWLTRITSLTFLVPTLAALAVMPWRGLDRVRLRRLGVAGLLALGLMGPFLVSCWITYGDALYPANQGVHFYRTRAGLSYDSSMTVVDHLTTSFRPMQMLDTLLIGYTAHPFAPKWNFGDWWPPLSRLLAGASLLGMAGWLALPRGRLLLGIHAAAMLPFSLAWDVLGGSPWRHSLHGYPFYLLAAAWTLHVIGTAVLTRRGRFEAARWLVPPRLLQAAAVAFALLGGGWILAHGLYYARKAEAVTIGTGRTLFYAGPRDALVFGRGWLPPTERTNWHSRYMRSGRAAIRLPLIAGHAYRFSLRMDPVALQGDDRRTVEVWLNGVRLRTLRMSYDPARTGEYVVGVPAAVVRDGGNDLELRTGGLVPVAELAEPPADLAPHWDVALELRYVGVERLPEPADRVSPARSP